MTAKPRFSANLGFLWNDRPLADAIYAAAHAGFSAVECHWPYDQDLEAMNRALEETGLPMLGLNTIRGNVESGENGLTALPRRRSEARQAIDQAIEWASMLGAKNVHVMAGCSNGPKAERMFIENLEYACDQASKRNVSVLIEPLNTYDAPGYFLSSTAQAKSIIQKVGFSNLRLMFDCYHVQLMEGDLTHRLEDLLPVIGHIQFASVPDRGPPDGGELNYQHIFQHIGEIGYLEPLGAEYKPTGKTEESLSWMEQFN